VAVDVGRARAAGRRRPRALEVPRGRLRGRDDRPGEPVLVRGLPGRDGILRVPHRQGRLPARHRTRRDRAGYPHGQAGFRGDGGLGAR
jgi:hypothetical protein